MFRSLTIVLVTGLPLVATVGCSTAPTSQADKQDLDSSASQKLTQAMSADPTLRPILDRSAGYAIFPNAGRGGFIVGGGYGKGVLYQNGRIAGYCDMSLASAGAEIGGKEFCEIIVFQTPDALQKFKDGQFSVRADASAVALTAGAAANTQFKDNTAVFIYDQQGLMADASVGAQNFRYTPAQSVPAAQPAGGRIEGPGSNSGADMDTDHY